MIVEVLAEGTMTTVEVVEAVPPSGIMFNLPISSKVELYVFSIDFKSILLTRKLKKRSISVSCYNLYKPIGPVDVLILIVMLAIVQFPGLRRMPLLIIRPVSRERRGSDKNGSPVLAL